MVHLDVAIRQIACGGLHTAAVTDAGTVYTCATERRTLRRLDATIARTQWAQRQGQ